MNSKIFSLSSSVTADVNHLIHDSNLKYINGSSLSPFPAQSIRVGRAGGLPFDSLTTDVVSGCLSERQACYGICFAAQSAWTRGIDFGKRVANELNPELVAQDLARLPTTQRYLRNGWNSDPSWDWITALNLGKLVHQSGRLIIFITKSFTHIAHATLAGLAAIGAEMRVSISALDNASQLLRRLKFIQDYRAAGGTVVPILMTAVYRENQLDARQRDLVAWLCDHDLPAAENSLRFPLNSSIVDVIDLKKTRRIHATDDVWSGRLYDDKLIFPTTTTIPDWYEGIPSSYLSQLDASFIESLFIDPVMTHEQVMGASNELRHPHQCGVAMSK
ncbi:hypothetical protein WN982_36860 [Paraburkholderia sp. IMGN_8]|uniref:hypothetical protein n=1 Tax=Paraburkholderia sp. IMGN_8 TaxID=3136564 RepID=UPI00310174FF